MSKELINKLLPLVEPIVEEKNCELYHLEMVEESGENYLMVYIDKENGVAIEDCVEVSRGLSDMLDIEDPINFSYILEVSSPGIERELHTEKHFKMYTGRDVKVKLGKLHEGRKKFDGTLKGFNATDMTFELEGNEFTVPREKVSSIKLKGEY